MRSMFVFALCAQPHFDVAPPLNFSQHTPLPLFSPLQSVASGYSFSAEKLREEAAMRLAFIKAVKVK